MLKVYAGSATGFHEYAECGFFKCLGGTESNLVLFPFLSVYRKSLLAYKMVLTHRGGVDQFNSQYDRALRPGPYREVVLFTSYNTNTKETFIIKTGMLVSMTGICEAYIMRVALKRSVIQNLYVSECLPSLECVGEFKRAVLYQLCVKAAVGSIVYILKEDAVHCALDGSTSLLEIYIKGVALCTQRHCRNKGNGCRN